MTLLTLRGEGPKFPYAGQPMHILVGHGDQPPGFAAMEITVAPHFAGPIPHAHDDFGEAIYVLSGRLLVLGDDEPQETPPGSMFVAPRGDRHGFSNPLARWPRCWDCGPRQSPPWPSAGHRRRAQP